MAVNDIFANTRVNIGDLLNTLAAQGNEQRSRATLQTGQDARQSMMDMVRQRQLREQMAMEVQEAQKARNAAMMQQSANSVLQALLQRGQQKAEAERQAAELGLRERLAGEAQTAETARSTARDAAELEAARIRSQPGRDSSMTLNAIIADAVTSAMGGDPTKLKAISGLAQADPMVADILGASQWSAPQGDSNLGKPMIQKGMQEYTASMAADPSKKSEYDQKLAATVSAAIPFLTNPKEVEEANKLLTQLTPPQLPTQPGWIQQLFSAPPAMPYRSPMAPTMEQQVQPQLYGSIQEYLKDLEPNSQK